jgi:hypothetical protein
MIRIECANPAIRTCCFCLLIILTVFSDIGYSLFYYRIIAVKAIMTENKVTNAKELASINRVDMMLKIRNAPR